MWIGKKRLQLLILLLISLLIFTSWMAHNKREDLSNDDFIRFHVIANSDSDADQQLKLEVRDGILAKINSELVREAMKSHSENTMESIQVSTNKVQSEENNQHVSLNLEFARQYINDNISELEEAAERIMREKGYDYPAKAELGVKWIPKKTYGDITFPAGNYEALNITIGEGKGQNWWCVLFPPLCLIGIEDPDYVGNSAMAQDIYKDVLLDEKYDPLTTQYNQPTTLKLKFKTLELIDKIK